MDQLAQDLQQLAYAVDLSYRPHGVLVIPDFKVEVGRHTGQVIAVGIPAADYPMTPPAGLHFRPGLSPIGQNNINQSPLGAEWHYWSRRLTDWANDRGARHIVSYINRVLLDA